MTHSILRLDHANDGLLLQVVVKSAGIERALRVVEGGIVPPQSQIRLGSIKERPLDVVFAFDAMGESDGAGVPSFFLEALQARGPPGLASCRYKEADGQIPLPWGGYVAEEEGGMFGIDEEDVRRCVHLMNGNSGTKELLTYVGSRMARMPPMGEDRLAFFMRCVNEHRVIKEFEVHSVAFRVFGGHQDTSAVVVN